MEKREECNMHGGGGRGGGDMNDVADDKYVVKYFFWKLFLLLES